MKLNSKSGFSLVELMVVVAIIGILATIAVPNFQRFQARARQSGAKTELTGIFTAQKGFHAEYQVYHSALPAVGFVPEGVQDAADYPVVASNRGRVYASSSGVLVLAAGAQMGAAGSGLPSTGPFQYSGGYRAHAAGCAAVSALGNLTAANFGATPAPAANAGSATAFLAVAAGCPASSTQIVARLDQWTMNQNRELRNIRVGLDR